MRGSAALRNLSRVGARKADTYLLAHWHVVGGCSQYVHYRGLAGLRHTRPTCELLLWQQGNKCTHRVTHRIGYLAIWQYLVQNEEVTILCTGIHGSMPIAAICIVPWKLQVEVGRAGGEASPDWLVWRLNINPNYIHSLTLLSLQVCSCRSKPSHFSIRDCYFSTQYFVKRRMLFHVFFVLFPLFSC